MRCDVVLTTTDNGQIVEREVDTIQIGQNTDIYRSIGYMARKHFKGRPYRVQGDKNIFEFKAVDTGNGDVITLR